MFLNLLYYHESLACAGPCLHCITRCSSVLCPLQVLIRVRACGVNPVETYIRAGTYARRPALPYTPGTDAAGVVEAVGEGVSAVKVRVTHTPHETTGRPAGRPADHSTTYMSVQSQDHHRI